MLGALTTSTTHRSTAIRPTQSAHNGGKKTRRNGATKTHEHRRDLKAAKRQGAEAKKSDRDKREGDKGRAGQNEKEWCENIPGMVKWCHHETGTSQGKSCVISGACASCMYTYSMHQAHTGRSHSPERVMHGNDGMTLTKRQRAARCVVNCVGDSYRGMRGKGEPIIAHATGEEAHEGRKEQGGRRRHSTGGDAYAHIITAPQAGGWSASRQNASTWRHHLQHVLCAPPPIPPPSSAP